MVCMRELRWHLSSSSTTSYLYPKSKRWLIHCHQQDRVCSPIGSLVVCDEKLVICSSDLLLILAHTTWQRRHQFLFQCCCCCCIHQESERNWPGWNWMNSQCWRLPWQRTYWFFMYALLFLFSSKVRAQKKKKVRPHSTSLRFFLSTCSSSVTSRCIL